ncbi:hypothetical protein GCM10010885_24250 [Alicyclobacillus cellulosilyticus]|uniref:Uncharacterized protein n=1 Tax=Alicyclobacillus cellulosilyticus TaxID=1003997 RepID=A0A917NNL9_9BACL|nr:hypothetical protein GCM10010885_24250 [Alicyclobacillus cellulosilyticus]
MVGKDEPSHHTSDDRPVANCPCVNRARKAQRLLPLTVRSECVREVLPTSARPEESIILYFVHVHPNGLLSRWQANRTLNPAVCHRFAYMEMYN